MRLAILIVTLVAFVLLYVLYQQAEGFTEQLSQSPSFHLGDPMKMPKKPTNIKTHFISESDSFQTYHFSGKDSLHLLYLFPGLGWYMSDWFEIASGLSDEGYYVISIPLEFMENGAKRMFSWGRRDGQKITILQQQLPSPHSIIIPDLAQIAVENINFSGSTHFFFINPKQTRSDYLHLLMKEGLGFSSDHIINRVFTNISKKYNVSDTLHISDNQYVKLYFNQNVIIPNSLLKRTIFKIETDWTYGKNPVVDIINLIKNAPEMR